MLIPENKPPPPPSPPSLLAFLSPREDLRNLFEKSYNQDHLGKLGLFWVDAFWVVACHYFITLPTANITRKKRSYGFVRSLWLWVSPCWNFVRIGYRCLYKACCWWLNIYGRPKKCNCVYKVSREKKKSHFGAEKSKSPSRVVPLLAGGACGVGVGVAVLFAGPPKANKDSLVVVLCTGGGWLNSIPKRSFVLLEVVTAVVGAWFPYELTIMCKL